MSELAENAWLAEQRGVATAYLEVRGIPAFEVGETPAFHIRPQFALWTVRSRREPTSSAWWVATGDVPTDSLSSEEGQTPRAAVAGFSRRWGAASIQVRNGEEPKEFAMGPGIDRVELGGLLARRSAMLKTWSQDDSLWPPDA